MRKAIVPAMLVSLTTAAALAQRDPVGRLYFDTVGNNGMQSSPRSGPTAQVNPQLPDGGGRLFLYWQFGHESQRMFGIGFDVEATGGGVSEAYYYKPQLQFGMERWNSARPNPPEPGSAVASFNAISTYHAGVRNYDGFEGIDQQFDHADGPFGSTLLGYVDVSNPSGESVELFLRGNTRGIAELGGQSNDTVYFGFGDAAVNTLTGVSDEADATIVPEPGSALLLAVVMGLSHRRRWAVCGDRT